MNAIQVFRGEVWSCITWKNLREIPAELSSGNPKSKHYQFEHELSQGGVQLKPAKERQLQLDRAVEPGGFAINRYHLPSLDYWTC